MKRVFSRRRECETCVICLWLNDNQCKWWTSMAYLLMCMYPSPSESTRRKGTFTFLLVVVFPYSMHRHLCASYKQSSSMLSYSFARCRWTKNLRQFIWTSTCDPNIHGPTSAGEIRCLWTRRNHRTRCLRVRVSWRQVNNASYAHFPDRCVFKGRNVTTNETVAIKKMSMLRTRNGLPTSVIREAALLKRVGKVDSDNLIKYGRRRIPLTCTDLFV